MCSQGSPLRLSFLFVPHSDRDCKKLTECEEGKSYESTAATVTSDRECTALTVCKEGEEETEAPTPTSDRKCRDPNVGRNCSCGRFI